jgi:hypothetical protein
MPLLAQAATVPASGIVLGLPEVVAIAGALLAGYGVLARVIQSLWRAYSDVVEARRRDAEAAIPALTKAAEQIAQSAAVLKLATQALRDLGYEQEEGA